MTREQALELLNLSDDSSLDQIQKRYNELFSDYQLRLTNAPVPNLKKKYQKHLQDLEQARIILLPHTIMGQINYPSTKPKLITPEEEPENTKTVQKKLRQDEKQKSKKGSSSGLIAFLIILCLGLAAAGIYLFLEWENTQKELEEAQKYEELAFFMENGKMRILNDCEGELKIYAVQSVFWDEEEKSYKKFESAYDLTLRPKETSRVLTKTKGTKELWGGEVVFFAVGFEYKGRRGTFMGLWSSEAKDNILKISL